MKNKCKPINFLIRDEKPAYISCSSKRITKYIQDVHQYIFLILFLLKIAIFGTNCKLYNVKNVVNLHNYAHGTKLLLNVANVLKK